MAERAFILYRLRSDRSRDEYVKWLQEEHYPWGRTLPGVTLLEGYFITEDFDPEVETPMWTNAAVIDIEDRDAWLAGQQGEEADYHWQRFGEFVEDYKIYFSQHIDA